jgi:hypothetical protein
MLKNAIITPALPPGAPRRAPSRAAFSPSNNLRRTHGKEPLWPAQGWVGEISVRLLRLFIGCGLAGRPF